MSSDIGGDHCIRRRVEINGENYYIILGNTFAHATTPFENRPERMNERMIVEAVVGAISAMLEERDENICRTT